jgi:hypothetical protein
MITIEQIKNETSQVKDFMIKVGNQCILICPGMMTIRTITERSDRIKRYAELHGMTLKNKNDKGFWRAVKRQLKKQSK